jgi:hypothetical protein
MDADSITYVHGLGSHFQCHACIEVEYVHGQIQPLGMNLRDDVYCLI